MDKYFLITGNNGLTSAHLSYDEVLSSSNLVLTSIPNNSINLSIPRRDWSRGSLFSPYAGIGNTGNYVANNDNVYLCISNNTNNIANIVNTSTYSPTHLSGKLKYADGYTWLFLYTINSTVSASSTNKTIPVPSFYGLKNLVINRETDNIECGVTGTTGTCAIYLTDEGKTGANLIYSTVNACIDCVDIAEETTKTDLLTTVFYPPSEVVASSILISSAAESLELFIASGKINPKLNFEAKTYQSAKSSGLSAGCILSANINILGIKQQEVIDGVSADTYLKLLSSEKTITATGGVGGTGASIEFKTIAYNNTYDKIVGINLVNGGTDYRSDLVTILLPGITSTNKKQALIDNITLLGTSKSLTFPNINSIFDVASTSSIGTENIGKIVNAKIDSYTTGSNFYGLVQADSYTKETVADVCPSRLKIYILGNSGATSGQEMKNINFNQTINQTEIHKR